MKTLAALISVLIISLITACNSEPGVTTNESGLKYKDDLSGEGRIAKDGDLISIHFIGWIIQDSTNLYTDWSTDSTRISSVIGNSYIRNQPVKFVLGEQAFIKGTDEGISGMKQGGKRTMIIPSQLAYGEKGVGPVPPNTDLKVFVELVEVKDKIVVEMWELDTQEPTATESGLKYIMVEQGEGENAATGNVVTVHYSGFLQDGTKFDSSVEKDEPITFALGNKQVIPGWDEGITYMKKGSKARLIVPPSLAYGDMAVGKIPANSTLIFDVELIDIK
ncbi:MAG: FKBP-type peptidyl-prolyl cis-trans isomerase [Ignavibacterium sp.]|nr:MAG: FKBP-type peptidyl-prolyl cis-trans isomerase [Ignavibacterium sp.]